MTRNKIRIPAKDHYKVFLHLNKKNLCFPCIHDELGVALRDPYDAQEIQIAIEDWIIDSSQWTRGLGTCEACWKPNSDMLIRKYYHE